RGRVAPVMAEDGRVVGFVISLSEAPPDREWLAALRAVDHAILGAGSEGDSVAQRTEALEDSEARFRTIFEDAAVGIALIDRENHVIASNPALQRMLGYTGGELRGRRFADLTHPEDLSASDELYQELREGKREHYHVEKRYLRK